MTLIQAYLIPLFGLMSRADLILGRTNPVFFLFIEEDQRCKRRT